MRASHLPGAALALALTALLTATAADARDPRLRADVVGASAFPSIGIDRSKDAYLHLDLEVEVPLYGPLTLGARAIPVFLYHPAGHAWNYGAGFGLTTRAYVHGAVHSGPFAGIAISTLRTHRTFDGNTSRLNFFAQLSLGWQSPDQHWHAMVILEHLSNSWTSEHNQGINGLGLSAGVDW